MLAALVLASASWAGLEYSVALDTAARAVRVEAAHPASSLPETVFDIATDNNPMRDFADNVVAVAAIDEAGRPLPVSRPGPRSWTVRHGGRPFRLRYSVDASKGGTSKGGLLYHPAILPERAVLLGWSYLLRPRRSGKAKISVSAPGYPRVMTGGSGYPAESVIVAGDLRSDRFTLDGATLTVVLQGGADPSLIPGVKALAKEQAALMGFYPAREALVAFVGSDSGSVGGTMVPGALVVFMDPALDALRDTRPLRTFAHEHFHLWNARHAGPRAGRPEGRVLWFMEGVASYYAAVTMARAGVTRADDVVAELNGWLQSYALNPVAKTATAGDMDAQLYAKGRHYETLGYVKGALLAFLIDLELRHASGGAATLDDFTRLAVRRFSKDGYDNAGLQSVLEELSGRSWDEFFASYIEGSRPLPLEDVFHRAGVAYSRAPLEEFELGFTHDTAELKVGSRVAAVQPGSNAARAGLQPGDTIVGIDLVQRPDREAAIRVSRSGQARTFSYFPARSSEGQVLRVSASPIVEAICRP